MSNPSTYIDDSDIVAATPAAALRLPIELLAGADKPALRETTDRLLRTLLGEPEATSASVTVSSGEVTVAAGDAFGDTSVDALDDHLDSVVNAAIDVYWHVELGDDEPSHFRDFDGSRSVRADGGRQLRSTPDPATAHPDDLLEREVRVDFGTRVETAEIRSVTDDVDRGRELRLQVTSDTGTRIAVVDPTSCDIAVLDGGDR